jgi:hypothetical protein
MTNIQKSPKYPTNFIEILEAIVIAGLPSLCPRRIAWPSSPPNCLAAYTPAAVASSIAAAAACLVAAGRPLIGPLIRYGVDSFSPSSWEPQEEGMMNIAARFSFS